MLPSSIFESEVEEKVGLLNKAAPRSGNIYLHIHFVNYKKKKLQVIINYIGLRLDLDPDIVAAMDDDFDYLDPDNELEDDFVVMANQAG